jgi:glutathione S-transferase
VRIFDFPFAPNPHKLRVYLAEKGVSIPLVRIDLRKGENQTPEFLAKNPLGALPVLELDDGSCLTESLAIIEYLEELHPEPPMIGTTPLERARARELERFADLSILNRITQIFLNTSPIFTHRKQSSQVAEQARMALPAALRHLDGRIGSHTFVAGERPTIADCTLYAAFEHAERADVYIDDSYENLMRWYAKFGRRPSARA